MFQLHYALALFGLGFVTGAFMHRSLILKCAVALVSFTATFGIGWGAITLIELALGFVVGNSIFGRTRRAASPTSNLPEQLRAMQTPVEATPPPSPQKVVPKIGKVIVCSHCSHERVIDHGIMSVFMAHNPNVSDRPYDPGVNPDKLRCTSCGKLGARIV